MVEATAAAEADAGIDSNPWRQLAGSQPVVELYVPTADQGGSARVQDLPVIKSCRVAPSPTPPALGLDPTNGRVIGTITSREEISLTGFRQSNSPHPEVLSNGRASRPGLARARLS